MKSIEELIADDIDAHIMEKYMESNEPKPVCELMVIFTTSIQTQCSTFMTKQEIENEFKTARRDRRDVKITTKEIDPSIESQTMYIALENLCMYVIREKKESKILTLEKPIISTPRTH